MSTFTLATQVFQANEWLSTTSFYLNKGFVFAKLLVSLFGTITIFIGGVLGAYRYVLFRLGLQKMTMDLIRLDLARSIILGLEFFVAGDVIETTIAPDFSSLGILGLLVVIRTVLNYSMEREIKNLSMKPDTESTLQNKIIN